ncbi:hypothetical protein HMPREF9102_1723 [Limosilactobacillus oris F0423]|uniref:Uncharacterized protein n=1 Tax=Limosilactobacillus oris F0423 TaxID=944562 RepID=A0ABN0D514_9LACO|nr:hypothetical protein HMPREF9102_1723 [Limosilactobacillus oris F0423]
MILPVFSGEGNAQGLTIFGHYFHRFASDGNNSGSHYFRLASIF